MSSKKTVLHNLEEICHGICSNSLESTKVEILLMHIFIYIYFEGTITSRPKHGGLEDFWCLDGDFVIATPYTLEGCT